MKLNKFILQTVLLHFEFIISQLIYPQINSSLSNIITTTTNMTEASAKLSERWLYSETSQSVPSLPSPSQPSPSLPSQISSSTLLSISPTQTQPYYQKNLNSTLPNFTYICNDHSNCNYNGTCLNSSHCLCNEYYLTLTNIPPFRIQCNYNQLSQSTAFLISFFLGPTGMDHIYIGKYYLGILKLFIPFSLIITGNIFFIIGQRKTADRMKIVGKLLEFSATIIIIFWWLIDWILFLTNIHKDENDISLYSDI
jgi:hypothetical protein